MNVNTEEIMQEIRSQIAEEQAQNVNVEEIMKEIRAQIRAEGVREQVPQFRSPVVQSENGMPQSETTDVWAQLLQELHYVNLNYDIPYYWNFGPAGLKTFAKRVVRKLLKCIIPPILARQIEFNAHTVRYMNAARYIMEKQQKENESLKQTLEDYAEKMNQCQVDIDALKNLHTQQQERQDQTDAEIRGNAEKTKHCTEELKVEISSLGARMQSLQNMAVESQGRSTKQESALQRVEDEIDTLKGRADEADRQSDALNSNFARTILKYSNGTGKAKPVTAKRAESEAGEQANEGAYQELDYFKFQNAFRGTRAQIKVRQAMYVSYFSNQKEPVLDIGCGRGEFLQLMSDNGIQAFGVDLYPEYVVEGDMNGLDVQQGDGIAYLEQADQMFGGIFVGQVIEHISFEQLVHLCKQAYQKLEPGAVLIMETPNPMSLSIFTSSFYIDPTHNKPVHPLTLEYVLREVGFTEVQTVYTDCSKPEQLPLIRGDGIQNLEEVNQAIQRVSNMLYGSQDYAIIAKK